MSSSSARGRVELARHLHELIEVFHAPLGLDRLLRPPQRLRLQRLDIAAPREHRLEQVPHGNTLLRPAPRSSAIVAMKPLSDFTAAAPRPGICSAAAAASHTDTPIVAEWATIRDSDVCPRPRRGELTMRVKLTTS